MLPPARIEIPEPGVELKRPNKIGGGGEFVLVPYARVEDLVRDQTTSALDWCA